MYTNHKYTVLILFILEDRFWDSNPINATEHPDSVLILFILEDRFWVIKMFYYVIDCFGQS